MEQPLSTMAVLRAEAKAIHGPAKMDGIVIPEDIESSSDEDIKRLGGDLSRRLGSLESTALCLSGGGIRSASFGLGIIQALASWAPRRSNSEDPAATPDADHALLGRFNYLSTVSGGGYIGSWLSAWLSRDEFKDVVKKLNSRSGAIGSVEASEINDLRRYSNYLTPKVGLMSADTWAAAAMVVRNLLLNWTLLLPLFLLSILAMKFVIIGITAPGTVGATGLPWFGPVSSWITGLFALAFATAALCVSQCMPFNQPSKTLDQQSRISITQKYFIILSLIPGIGAGLLWTALLNSKSFAGMFPRGCCTDPVNPEYLVILISAAVGAFIFAMARVIARLILRRKSQSKDAPWLRLTDLRHRKAWGWMVAGACYGALIGLGTYLLLPGFDPITHLPDPQKQFLLTMVGLPWFLMSQLVAESVYVALTSAAARTDEQREWFARSAGWFMAAGAFWVLGSVPTMLGSLAVALAQGDWHLPISLSALATVVTSLIGWLTGSSSRTPPKGAAKGQVAKLYSALAIIAATLFFGLLLVLGSAWIDWVALNAPLVVFPDEWFGWLDAVPVRPDDICMIASRLDAAGHLAILTLILLIIAWLASHYVNVNRFSLHSLYRNRLVRAFLGASHRERKPDRFTGFDMEDNCPMAELWEDGHGPYRDGNWRPFHILNMTLNLVSSRDLAWQQRKAMSFTVSPLHSGAAGLRPQPEEDGLARTCYVGAYRPSNVYGGVAHQNEKTNEGITLGTAMAISGAAANPNMGYHSSPLVSLLMTMLNVRLGWWLGNPGEAGENTWKRNGPLRAAFPIVMEAFGLTNENRPYVNLSDGGHFENLGLYEMVRRRCRYIVVSDAGCDPDFAFEDLGNAVRKIGIDFGIPVDIIRLQDLKPRPDDPDKSLPDTPYHAIGLIDYATVDGEGAEEGVVLYVKAGFHNCNESAGVKAYAKAHPEFPQESTADQWFDEAQFESYRALGFEIMTMILDEAAANDPQADLRSGKDLLVKLLNNLKEEAKAKRHSAG